ncbi:hypothetical protein [Pontiella sulfatireligans]
MKYILLAISILTASVGWAAGFATDGNGIRNAISASINGEGVLYVSEIDGTVSCHTTSGKTLWRNPTDNPAVMFEIEAADLDGDGNDDLLAASGNGNIYCWGHDGQLRWTFNPGRKVRFSEVAVVKNGDTVQIFAGGNDCVLYELDTRGNLVSETKYAGIIRKLEAGNFVYKDQQSLLVMAMTSDKWSWSFLGIIDPRSKEVLVEGNIKKGELLQFKSLMINELTVADIDGDGLDDFMFVGTGKADSVASAARDAAGQFVVMNGKMKPIVQFGFPKKDKQLYAHGFAASLQPVRNEIAVNFGTVLYVLGLDGQLIARTGKAYEGFAFNGLTVEPESRQLFGDGQLGGGTTLHAFDLTQDHWWEAPQQLLGRLAEVESNLDTLYRQSLKFKRPAYQKKSEEPWVLVSGREPNEAVANLKGEDLKFVTMSTWSEDFDRSKISKVAGEGALKKDRRKPYDLSQGEIIARARKMEQSGVPFTLWAGHGTDPFYMQVETMIGILEAAPTTCYGFVYAEMGNPEDPRSHYFVNHYIPQLAPAMRKQGRAKLFFRFKNIFWAAGAHLHPWDQLFFSRDYADLVVPTTEDTNSSTQDINLAGRVGMFMGGYVDQHALRLVEDNVCCWRPESACGQTSISPFLRSGVLRAAYGARYGIISGLKFQQEPGIQILYALMKSGVLPQVQPEDILSVGSWHLMKDIDEHHVEISEDGHDVMLYTPEDDNAVISVGGVGWSGAGLSDHDLSKVALGVDYRWLNFIPELPNGMVPIAPIGYQSELKKRGTPFSVSSTKEGFINGKKVPANQFGTYMRQIVEAGAARMPIAVKGASWSAIRLDDRHVRLILIDPGYIDPQERQAVISFQGRQPVSAMDILSTETLDASSPVLTVTVPAGSMRFIDLAY